MILSFEKVSSPRLLFVAPVSSYKPTTHVYLLFLASVLLLRECLKVIVHGTPHSDLDLSLHVASPILFQEKLVLFWGW